MYSVYLKYKNNEILIHSSIASALLPKLLSGEVSQGINTIDSFSFEILPNNPGFNRLVNYSTKIKVVNNNNNKILFNGRVLDFSSEMTEEGIIYKKILCESFLGYLQDSIQPYLKPRNWTRIELLTYILENHNNRVEEEKRIILGDVKVASINENIYIGLQRQTSFDAIKEKLLNKIGGEIRIRESDDKLYLDYYEKFGSELETPIKLRVNMKNLSKEDDFNEIITRLYPYGAKIQSEDESIIDSESDERVDITSVNNGIPYIEDQEAIKVFGIIERTQNWDDVTLPNNLLDKASQFLSNNNRIKRKYSISNVDLSLINKAFEEIELYNYYPVQNEFLNINEKLRVIKKKINIIDPTEFSIEVGDSIKSILDIQLEDQNKFNSLNNTVIEIKGDYVTNEKLSKTKKEINNTISQIEDNIKLSVSETYTSITDFENFKEENEASIDIKTNSIIQQVSQNELRVDQLEEDTTNSIEKIEESFTSIQTSNQQRFEIVESKIEEGTSSLKNKTVVIDIQGIKVATNLSKISTIITNNTFAIRDNAGFYLAYFGYDEKEGRSKAEMDNLAIKNYFTAGYHRQEKFEIEEEKRTGWFHVGGV